MEHLTGFLLLARHVIVDVQHAEKCVRKWSSAGFHRSAISWRHESQNNETDNDLSDKNAITHCEFKLKTMKYCVRSINALHLGLVYHIKEVRQKQHRE